MIKPVKVFQYTLDNKLVREWSNITEAAVAAESSESTMRRHLGKLPLNGYYWRKATPGVEASPANIRVGFPDLEETVNKILESRLNIPAHRDNAPLPPLDENNVLIISDLHLPFEKEGYLDFCKDVRIRYRCGTVIQIGDLVDYCFSSRYEVDPDGFSAGHELRKAKERIAAWHGEFPHTTVILGNHDVRPHKRVFSGKVTKEWLRDFKDIYSTPSWDYVDEYVFNDVLYIHGSGTGKGFLSAYYKMLERRRSVVQGHIHTQSSIIWSAADSGDLFAMQVGCGIDRTAYAMNYARDNIKLPILNCGVVIDNIPVLVPFK
jgi:hypothetical protein